MSPSILFLFRYGIDIKEMPFIPKAGGLKLLLLCKSLLPMAVLVHVYIIACVLIPLSTVLALLSETTKDLHFFRLSSMSHPLVKAS